MFLIKLNIFIDPNILNILNILNIFNSLNIDDRLQH